MLKLIVIIAPRIRRRTDWSGADFNNRAGQYVIEGYSYLENVGQEYYESNLLIRKASIESGNPIRTIIMDEAYDVCGRPYKGGRAVYIRPEDRKRWFAIMDRASDELCKRKWKISHTQAIEISIRDWDFSTTEYKRVHPPY